MKIVLNDIGSGAAVEVAKLLNTVVDKVWDAACLMERNGIDKGEIPFDRVLMNEFRHAVNDLLGDNRAEKWWLYDGKKLLNFRATIEDGDVVYTFGYEPMG